MNYEGFWYSKHEPHFPMPVPDILTQEEADAIFAKIKRKERSAERTLYRGFSVSRIDKKTIIGSAEYFTTEWTWPDGFAEHYVQDHRVKPTDEFLKFIGYKKEN